MTSLPIRKQSLVPSFAAAPKLTEHPLKRDVFATAFSAACRRFGRRHRGAGTLLLLLGIAVGAQAQAPQLASWTTAVGGSSVYGPVSIAFDRSGNLYVVNNLSNAVIPGITGVVLKIPPSDPTCSIPGDCINVAPSYNSNAQEGCSGGFNLQLPISVAVDSGGDVFIHMIYCNWWSDPVPSFNTFVRVPSSDLTCSTPGDCIETPLTGYDQGPLAVDGSDSVYFSACPSYDTCGVSRYTLSGNAYTSTSLFITYTTDGVTSTGNRVSGIAADASGNLFLLLGGNLVEYALSGGTYTPTTIPSNFFGPVFAVAVDWSGNIYVSGQFALWKFTPSAGGAYTQSSVGPGDINAFTGDASGDIYIGFDYGGDTLYETHTGPVNFGAVQVGATSPAIQLNFLSLDWNGYGPAGPSPVLTQGAAGLDFIPATNVGALNGYPAYPYGYPDGSCGNDNQSNPCYVYVQFAPTKPGERQGAAGVLNNSGATVGTTLIQGVGVGPQATFATIDLTTGAHLPSVQSSLGSGFDIPNAVAVDGSGNVFVTDQGFHAIEEIQAAGGYSTVNSLGTGFYDPGGVAVDGAGDVFVADSNNGEVKEILAAGGYTTINTLGSGFTFPTGVALDGSGNVFVTDAGNGMVKEILVAGGYTTVNTVGSGFSFSYPSGMAVDAGGNVFVADPGHNKVKEILAASGYTTVNTLGSGFSEPSGVAVDASGNVFVADDGNNAVKEILAAGGYTTVITLAGGFKQPTGVALDGKGNVYVADWGNHRVEKLDYADPPTLSFATTPEGQINSGNPHSVSVSNDGNAPLIFPLPPSGDNPSVSGNFVWDPASTCLQTTASSSQPFQLAAGASCTMAFDFQPTEVGAISGSAVVTDNNLNQAGAMQTIQFSGYGNPPPAALTSPTPGSTLTGPSLSFAWSAPSGATSYILDLGTTVGAKDLFGSGTITATSSIVYKLPTNGSTVYARIYTLYGTKEFYIDYTYTAASQSVLTGPTPGGVLTGPVITFDWSTATAGATGYIFDLGTTVGAKDLYGSGTITKTSATVYNLPTNGPTLYARMITVYGTKQIYTDYIYTATAQSALTLPTPGTVLTGPTVTFNWSSATGATGYIFDLGTTTGAKDIYGSGTVTTTAATVYNLPTGGSTVHARIYTLYGTKEFHTDYTYTAATRSALTLPTPGSVLAGSTVTFNWSAATGTPTGYIFDLGTTQGAKDLYGSGTITKNSATVYHFPIAGQTIYARMFTVYGTKQVYTDYVYTAAP